MSGIKACLFGGALMSAGITASADNPPFFVGYGPGPGYAGSITARAVDNDTGQSQREFVSPDDTTPRPIRAEAASGPVSGFVDVGQNAISLGAQANNAAPGSSAYGFNYLILTLPEPIELEIAWDITPGLGSDKTFLFSLDDFIDDLNPTTLFSIRISSSNPEFSPSGSESFLAPAGTFRFFAVAAIDEVFETSVAEQVTGSITFIPAPGTAALAGFTGLAAIRRRR